MQVRDKETEHQPWIEKLLRERWGGIQVIVSKRLVEVKLAGIQRNGSGPATCSLEVVLVEGRRIEIRRDFDAETLARLIRTIEQI